MHSISSCEEAHGEREKNHLVDRQRQQLRSQHEPVHSLWQGADKNYQLKSFLAGDDPELMQL